MKLPVCLLSLLVLAAIPTLATEPIRVSCFSTVLGEIARKVGGGRVAVTDHIKPGVDPHDFEPTPADLQEVSRAELVLLSARQLEGYLSKLQEATGGKGNFLRVGDQFAPRTGVTATASKEASSDPHWWHSIELVQQAAHLVQSALTRISPADRAAFSANAKSYQDELEGLKRWVKNKLAELPRNRRKLVTSHDAFRYFADENGFALYPVEGHFGVGPAILTEGRRARENG